MDSSPTMPIIQSSIRRPTVGSVVAAEQRIQLCLTGKGHQRPRSPLLLSNGPAHASLDLALSRAHRNLAFHHPSNDQRPLQNRFLARNTCQHLTETFNGSDPLNPRALHVFLGRSSLCLSQKAVRERRKKNRVMEMREKS